MNVLIDDGFALSRVGGVGRYTSYILAALRERNEQVHVAHSAHNRIVGMRPVPLRRMVYSAWLNLGYPKRAANSGFDIIHFTNYAVPRRRSGSLRYAVSIHDMVPFLHAGTKSGHYSRYLRRTIMSAIRSAGCVFALTEAAKAEIVGILGLDPAMVYVCSVGSVLDSASAPVQSSSLPLQRCPPYLLTVGTIERRKNIDSLVRAMPVVWNLYPDMQLQIVGRDGIGSARVQEAITAVDPDRRRIHVITNCDDAVLAVRYSHAAAFVFPSFYEGLGIPLLEAMASGTPVVGTRIPSTLEVTGGAAVIVDPTPEALADGILQVLGSSELRTSLQAKGLLRAAQYNPTRTADELLRGYGALMNT